MANVLEVFLFRLLCSGESSPQTGPYVMLWKISEAELPLNTDNTSIFCQDVKKFTFLCYLSGRWHWDFENVAKEVLYVANYDVFYYMICGIFLSIWGKSWQCDIYVNQALVTSLGTVTARAQVNSLGSSSNAQRADGGLPCSAVVGNLLSHLFKHMVNGAGETISDYGRTPSVLCFLSFLLF